MLTLSEMRRHYKPKIPQLLKQKTGIVFEEIKTPSIDPLVKPHFPCSKQIVAVQGRRGTGKKLPKSRIGIVFSGGPAPGAHNIVSGIFDTLSKQDSLVGFIGGPGALVTGYHKELKAAEIDRFRNQGGFDLLGTGRTKIETAEQFRSISNVAKKLKLDGIVIVGGDDSNTNAALLAEHFLKEKVPTSVIGVPKTIDGDIQNRFVPIPFGFDTAAKIYSEMIGNLGYDTLSSLKYFHFVKLMGRSASHLTLECALKTHPNVALISEENKTVSSLACELADWVESREKNPYGIVLVPEGLFESSIDQNLPRDAHGNINLSQIETEKFLIEAVHSELKKRRFKGRFEPHAHFYGYEGRCGHPSNFDANYSYALGTVAALLILHRYTALMAYVGNLSRPTSQWTFGGAPLPPLLKMEERHGELKPVIEKALVDLQGKPYKLLQKKRPQWRAHSAYVNVGPMQFEGKAELTDSIPLILC